MPGNRTDVQVAADLLAADLEQKARPWRAQARPKQLPPDGDWSTWLIMTGRGWGKTWTGSNWLAEQAMTYPETEWAVLAPTFRDVRATCIEGSTGLLKAFGVGEVVSYHRNELKIELSNGSRILGYSGDQPERVRGPNLAGAWFDELGSIRYPAVWYETLVPALRVVTVAIPRVTVTTTPRPTALIRDLVSRTDGSVHVTRGATWENSPNLAGAALTELRRRYEGTRIGRQELEGELIEAAEGALWQRAWLDAGRVGPGEVPDLTRIVIAIDPAVTSGAGSDDTGIIVAGESRDGHGYVLADLSLRGSPDACMRRAVRAYHEHQADRIVAEANSGGDYLESLLRTIDQRIPYRKVSATRGKAVRAEPVSALYEQGKVHHVGCFAELEDQLCTWTPADAKSPDRLDALVWAFTEMPLSQGSPRDIFWVVTCGNPACRFDFSRDPGGGLIRTRCPRCGTAIPEEDSDGAATPDGTAPASAAQPQPQPGTNPLQPAAFPMPPALAQMLDRWQGYRR